ncbi:MAG: hypothetical protein PWQ57_304 [Desulfovibrionales bacterium]|jgi:hypothetical protein|nr:hypothetical protein [Desulfovibrionales bacterium]
MAHDAEYAQQAFLKEKDERNKTKVTRLEFQKLQDSVQRVESCLHALRQDILTIKEEIHAKA